MRPSVLLLVVLLLCSCSPGNDGVRAGATSDSGAVVTESVFAWPGIGGLFTESLAKRDYTVLMAFLMCGATAVAILNLFADVAVYAIDPRTREPA